MRDPNALNRLAGQMGMRSQDCASEKDCVAMLEFAAELRTLAQQQGTAGGVAEIPTGTEVSVDVSTGDDDFEHRIFATVTGVQRDRPDKPVILCEEKSRNFATPAHSRAAGVTDEMVERACAAHDRMYDHCAGDTRASMREDMRRALTAALAPQPKDASR